MGNPDLSVTNVMEKYIGQPWAKESSMLIYMYKENETERVNMILVLTAHACECMFKKYHISQVTKSVFSKGV